MTALPDSRLIAVGRTGNTVIQTLGEHGIAADRIEMLDRLPLTDYLALHHRVDFFLDTFPYCGGTTTLLAMWMGVPFITLAGNTPTSRTSAGLLDGIDLGRELIAANESAYVTKTISAVSNLPQLAEWRATFRPRFAPLLDSGAGYVRELEFHFRAIWREWCERQPK